MCADLLWHSESLESVGLDSGGVVLPIGHCLRAMTLPGENNLSGKLEGFVILSTNFNMVPSSQKASIDTLQHQSQDKCSDLAHTLHKQALQ